MSAMGFQKKFGWGWVGGVSSILVFFGFLDFINFAKPLAAEVNCYSKYRYALEALSK